MRVAVIGRTDMLLGAAQEIVNRGHVVPLVWTARSAEYSKTTEEDFRAFALKNNAVFLCSSRISSEDDLAIIYGTACDIAISINFPTLLTASVLTAFTYGVLNAHCGDLPRYRGNACPNWAILNGEKEVGLCIHLMTEDLDSGPIVSQKAMLLGDNTYITDIYAWMEAEIPIMLAQSAEDVAKGVAVLKPQSEQPQSILCVFPRRADDGKIDWKSTVETVLRLVRASSRPFHGAFTTLEGKLVVTIWRAMANPVPYKFSAVPGQVCFSVSGDPVIACSDGMIRLLEVSVDGCTDNNSSKSKILSSFRNRLI
jgi:methionyl-tRNA formyltransferase